MAKDNTSVHRTLTRAEMDIMNILWDRGHGMTTHEIIDCCPTPKPVYSTMATFLKILDTKGFISHHKLEGKGKTFVYYPLVMRAEYTRWAMKNVKETLFGGSLKSLISFFVEDEELSGEDIRDIMTIIDNGGKPL